MIGAHNTHLKFGAFAIRSYARHNVHVRPGSRQLIKLTLPVCCVRDARSLLASFRFFTRVIHEQPGSRRLIKLTLPVCRVRDARSLLAMFNLFKFFFCSFFKAKDKLTFAVCCKTR